MVSIGQVFSMSVTEIVAIFTEPEIDLYSEFETAINLVE